MATDPPKPAQPQPQIRVGGQHIRLRSLPDPPWNPEKQRETVREFLAKATLYVLAGTIFLGFVLIAFDMATVEEVRSLLEAIIPAEVALVGSAIGFYFGGKTGT